MTGSMRTYFAHRERMHGSVSCRETCSQGSPAMVSYGGTSVEPSARRYGRFALHQDRGGGRSRSLSRATPAMNPRSLIALPVVCLILLSGSPRAATLYRYDFENVTTESWTPANGSWSLCRTVTTGTQEYCQTDTTATLTSTTFDGDATWS